MKSTKIHSASRPITRIPNLSACLGSQGAAVVGWGLDRRALELTAQKVPPWPLLEDGFLRSIAREHALLSLDVDALDIYLDARDPYSFFRTSWVQLLRLLKVLSACQPIIDTPRSGRD